MLRDGDRFEMTQEVFDKLGNHGHWRDFYGCSGKLVAKRASRTTGRLAIEWDDGRVTNVSFLNQAGIEYELPEFVEIPLMESDSDLLSEHEKLIRGLVETGGAKDQVEATEIMLKVEKALTKYNMALYHP